MKKPISKIIEDGDFTIYSRQVDQHTLEEKIIVSRDGRIIAMAVKRRGDILREVEVDAVDKEHAG